MSEPDTSPEAVSGLAAKADECELDYGDPIGATLRALSARLQAAEAEREALREALVSLEKRASRVSSLGAQTGPQWTKLTIGILGARAVIASRQEGET